MSTRTAATTNGVKELAFREEGGVGVTLLWQEVEDRLRVIVQDTQTGETFELDAPPDNALDVFYHPFAYVPQTAA
jgi:hypothetical protein